MEIGRHHERRALGHLDIGLLAIAGDAHVIEDLALELDAAAAAKGRRAGERTRELQGPVSKGFGGDVPHGSPQNPAKPRI